MSNVHSLTIWLIIAFENVVFPHDIDDNLYLKFLSIYLDLVGFYLQLATSFL